MRMRAAALIAVLLLLAAGTSHAGDWSGASPSPSYQPQVPISALARPSVWLDPSRLHFATSFSFGSGFGGSSALQVTSLSYQFRAPLWLNVSMGNMWSGSSMRNGSPFLEGIDLGYRPFSSMLLRIQYRDIRSPLQYDPYGDPTRVFAP
jgi:hypothetical protein